jgi:hypothetical protein
MTTKHIRIFQLLIFFIIVNISIIKGKKIKTNDPQNLKLRRLWEETVKYDTTYRDNEEDKNSIELCNNSDYKYFIEYVTGHNTTFDKDINKEYAVSYNNK